MSNTGRLQVLAHIKAGKRLEGTGAPETGIDQCRIVIEELEKALVAAAGPSDQGAGAEAQVVDAHRGAGRCPRGEGRCG